MTNRSFGDFDALAREYWARMGEMMQQGAVPPAGLPGWDDAMGAWSRMATGGVPGVDDMVGRFDRQARDWYGRFQELAAGFIGRDAGAADVAEACKQMLGGAMAQPFADMFDTMGGPGQQGFDQWMKQAGPFLGALQGEGRAWLGMPTFGFNREHQARWQRIAQLHMDYQSRSQACQALLAEAGQKAFQFFEDKLADHAQPGRQLTSARALFDLWVDAAEEAYAEVAMSPRYREDFGEMVNAQMRLRAAVQHEVELVAGLFGMPSRTEIDSAHRKIVQLERELRRLRDAVAGAASATVAPAKATAPATGAKAPARSRSSTAAPVRRAEARTASSKPTAKAASAKKPLPAKRVAAKKASAKRMSTKDGPAKGASVKKRASSTAATRAARSTAARRTPATRKAASKPVTKVPRPRVKGGR